MPLELGPNGTVEVVPPPLPHLELAPPSPGAALVVPVPGPRGRQGEQGEQGEPGPATPSYVHIQNAPATLWQITHGLNYRPAGVLATDTDGGWIEPDLVTWPSNQIIELHFGVPVAGTVHLS